MTGGEVSVQATGFSHPPDRKPIQKRPGAPVEWHLAECPVPNGKCLAAPLKTGCASAPKPHEQ